ncbi:glycosyl transferase [Clostridia bacterium]|nr:glycosyl transferase [Clostridia bacterium]
MIKISVIIAVYNVAETFLRECLDSVASQTYQNMEVLLVDDGATDKTPEICAEYAAKDSRFVLLRKENGGQGAARNYAMSLASGDYFMYIDDDDYWLSGTLVYDISKLLEESRADVLSFEYAEFFGENDRPALRQGSCPRNRVYKKDDALKTLLALPPKCFSAVPHTKAVKAELVRRNNIHFADGLSGEDILFTAGVITHAKTYDRYDMAAYAFRRANPNSDSTLSHKKYKIEHQIIEVFNQILEGGESPRLLDFLASPYAYWLGMAIGALDFYKNDEHIKEEIKKDIEAMKKYAYVLKFSSRAYVRVIGVSYSLFGMGSTMALLRLYLTLNRKNKLSLKRKIN